jgi:hypothetical protein
MSAEQLDKDMLATLTDEERAAIEGDDVSAEEKAALEAVAGAAGNDEDDDEDDDDGADEGDDGGETGEAAGKAGETAEATVETAAEAAGGDGDDEPAPARTRYVATLPEDYADRVAALKQASTDLATAFRNGDIDLDEFQLKTQEIADQREELTAARIKAEVSSEMDSQTEEQEWNDQVMRFVVDTAKAGAIDYRKDALKQKDWDLFVKTLANDPANNDKPGEWFLKEAHKRVLALHGLTEKTVKQDPPPSRKPGKESVPSTLAHVPGGDNPADIGGNEFADLDGLDGDELEMAIHRMTPAQREKYSKAA